MIRYRRRGHAGSTPVDGLVSIEEHAQDCRALLGALDVKQAHVVGHSYGACVALQLAIDAPGVVYSLALFEPPRVVFAVSSAQQFWEAVDQIMQRYTAGDPMGAVEGLFSLVNGPDWRAEVSHTVPGGPTQAEKDVATLFESDLPSLRRWRFGADKAAKIKQPVLFLSGAESGTAVIEVRDLLHALLPHIEDDVMPGANHLLHMRNPADAAMRLANFLKRHAVRGSEMPARRTETPSAATGTVLCESRVVKGMKEATS